MNPGDSLRDTLGGIDIYLLDQVVKGRITPDMTILDAGCGGGRNLIYLASQGAQVWGVDRSKERVQRAFRAVAEVAPETPSDRFRCEGVEALTLEDSSFDVVICSAVLHFATGPDHFHQMLDQIWRVLRLEGLLFCRLASNIGIEDAVVPQANGWYSLPDGSERFLVDEATLLDAGRRLGAELLEPLKTTNVQGLRCMTTWVVRKSGQALATGA